MSNTKKIAFVFDDNKIRFSLPFSRLVIPALASAGYEVNHYAYVNEDNLKEIESADPANTIVLTSTMSSQAISPIPPGFDVAGIAGRKLMPTVMYSDVNIINREPRKDMLTKVNPKAVFYEVGIPSFKDIDGFLRAIDRAIANQKQKGEPAPGPHSAAVSARKDIQIT